MSDPPERLIPASRMPDLLDSFHEGLFVANEDLEIVYTNRACRAMFHKDAGEMEGNLPGEAVGCLHSEDHGCGKGTWCPCGLYDGLSEVLAGGEPVRGETLSIPVRAGEVVEVKSLKISIHALSGEAGEEGARRVMAFLDDVTQLVRRTDELRTCQEMLERRATQCEALTETILHDIRAPLAGVRGLWEAGEGEPDLEKVADRLSHLNLSVQSLLLLSQMDASGLPVSKEVLDPYPLLAEAHRVLSETPQGRRVRIELEPEPEEIPSVSADRKILSWVLETLFRNAAEQSPDGGTVTGGLSAPTQAEVEIAVSFPGRSIPEEHIENIFDPFFHLEFPEGGGRRNRGLPFCRLAALALGGSIHAENLEGDRVGFRLVLSVRRRTTGTQEEA